MVTLTNGEEVEVENNREVHLEILNDIVCRLWGARSILNIFCSACGGSRHRNVVGARCKVQGASHQEGRHVDD